MTNSSDLTEELLDGVVAVARSAGRAIMQVYATDFAVENKADASPLTLADREAHRLIHAGLQALTPHIPILSEESPASVHEFQRRRQWRELWLVDPLDGTREFVKRNGEFTVNIALIRDHRPALGVVLAPATDIAYFGRAGGSAFRAIGTEPKQPIKVHVPARSPPVVVGSRSHHSESLQGLLGRLGPHELQSVGSALKFCRLAEGAADFYPRFGDTSEWDTAAGQAVLESAGGLVLNLQGLPLRYNQRETLLNPHFIALGDPQFRWRQLVGPCSVST